MLHHEFSVADHFRGFTLFEFSIGSKWLEVLKEIAPVVKRVAVVFSPDTAPFAPLFWQPVVDAAARSFAVAPMQMPVRDGRELAGEIEALAREPDGGLMVLPDVSTGNNRDLIIALAARHRLPAVYPFRYFATSGGLFSYGSDVADLFRRAPRASRREPSSGVWRVGPWTTPSLSSAPILDVRHSHSPQLRDRRYLYGGMDGETTERSAILGALSLYLNFINMFTLLLQLFGQREE